MNALQNMECVKNGQCTLKEQSLIAMNSYFTNTVGQMKQAGKPTEVAEQQFATLAAKAEQMPDEFFAGIDCPWDFPGKEIAAAVWKA